MEKPVPAYLDDRLQYLVEQNIIEKIGRGRGVHHLLSRRFYRFFGKTGLCTRRRGLDRDTNKALLMKHIRDSADHGSYAVGTPKTLERSISQVRASKRTRESDLQAFYIAVRALPS